MIVNNLKKININADIGEHDSNLGKRNDDKIIKLINSANIACGAHAGDSNIMNYTITNCIKNNVSIGAHPGFFDKINFGRNEINLSSKEIENLIAYQLGALIGIANILKAKVSHIKPHGALNNMACEDSEISKAIIKGFKVINPKLILLAPYKSNLYKEGIKQNIKVFSEVFADRKYLSNFTLAPRSIDGSVINDNNECLNQAVLLANEDYIKTIDGKKIKLKAESICIHGDKKNSYMQAKKIFNSLNKKFNLCQLTEM